MPSRIPLHRARRLSAEENKTWRGLAAATVALLAAATVLCAPEKPGREAFAQSNAVALSAARKAMRWDVPTEPTRIVGPLHYVGTTGLGAYLFATSDGLILFNTGTPESGPLIEASIRKLGFDPKNIRILINGHVHMDHAGAFAHFKQRTGAQVAIMERDVAAIEDGGKSDFQYGHDWKVMGQPPVKVDRVLRDRDSVRLGEVVLVAHHTPGHTRGATTWETTLSENGRAYRVVWPDGGSINPGYRVAGASPSYPGIEQDYRRTFQTLESLTPDIFLGAHTEWFGYADKRKRAKTAGVKAWVNPDQYRRFVAEQKAKFERTVKKQHGGAGR